VLRCLGATSGRTFAIYLTEAAAIGLIGSLIGASLGTAFQRFLPRLLTGLIPIDVVPTLSWHAILLGIGTGIWITLTFSMLPILGVRRISPLQALRRDFEPEKTWRDVWWILASLTLVASTVSLAVHQVGSWRQGLSFSAGVALTFAVLWAAAWALTRVMRQKLPESWPYVWRQGLANLHRPANQTTTLILGIGLAAFLLGTIYLVQHNLLHQLRSTGGPARPNLVLFDIQPDQMEGLRGELRAAGWPLLGPTPIVPMRIRTVKGRPVSSLLSADSASGTDPSRGWALRREYRSTYRDTLVPSERVVAGTWNRAVSSSSPVFISVERDLAQELGIGVGDEIVWDIQGRTLPSRVASLREVEWARFEPNFFVVFGSGALERAPQTLVVLTRIPSPDDRGRFQRRIAERFPNVSTLDLSLVQESLERLVNRVALAIRFMAVFCLGVGVLVLVGALATSRFQRIREGALLRTLGASRPQVFKIVLAEYLSLGLLASAVAVVLAVAAGWALARFVFESDFSLPTIPMAALVLGIVGLTVLVGLANSREVVRHPPLEVLRDQ
jgi:putative ABC transport system permease protein